MAGTSPAMTVKHEVRISPLQRLGRDDLDAEASEAHIGALGRGQQPDRGDAEVFEDLRAQSDLAPLPAARRLRAARFLRDPGRRHARSAVSQIDDDARALALESLQR